jgi:hypothetical protein
MGCWNVGDIVGISGRTHGYGFSVVNEHRAPLFTLTYETAEEAEAAQALVAAALTGVIEITSHPDPSRI